MEAFFGTYFTQYWGDGEGVYTPPLPEERVSPWHQLDVSLQSWDGDVFNITNPESGAFLTNGNIRGFELHDPEILTAIAAAVDGSLYLGTRIPERELFLPIHLYNDIGSQDWLEFRRRFMRAFRPGKASLLSVRQPAGETRYIEQRFRSLDAPLTMDRAKFGHANNGITTVAHWPFWMGKPVVQPWSVEASDDYHSAPGDSYVAFISPGSTFGEAVIDNPGDMPAWLDWRVDGPITAAEIGMGDTVVSIGALEAGESRTLRTAPYGRSMVDENGADVTSELGGGTQRFAPVEAGESVPLAIDLTGATSGASVTASLTPLHLEAY